MFIKRYFFFIVIYLDFICFIKSILSVYLFIVKHFIHYLIFKHATCGLSLYFNVIIVNAFITNCDDLQTDQKLKSCFIHDHFIKFFNFLNY